MEATIQRWGNSQGLRIPKILLDSLGIQENDRVELTQTECGIHIQKVTASHRTLEERLIAFYSMPIEQIPRIDQKELDWGDAQGGEIW